MRTLIAFILCLVSGAVLAVEEIPARQTEAMPQPKTPYALEDGTTYRMTDAGPAETATSKALRMANEFVFRTALRHWFKLPGEAVSKSEKQYVVVFGSVLGKGKLEVAVADGLGPVEFQTKDWDEQAVLAGIKAAWEKIAAQRMPDAKILADDHYVKLDWNTAKYDVRGAADKDGEVRIEHIAGPKPNGLIVTVWLSGEEGQAERPQTIDLGEKLGIDGHWKTYLGEAIVPALKMPLLEFNVAFGRETDKDLLALACSPERWFQAAGEKNATADGDVDLEEIRALPIVKTLLELGFAQAPNSANFIDKAVKLGAVLKAFGITAERLSVPPSLAEGAWARTALVGGSYLVIRYAKKKQDDEPTADSEVDVFVDAGYGRPCRLHVGMPNERLIYALECAGAKWLPPTSDVMGHASRFALADGKLLEVRASETQSDLAQKPGTELVKELKLSDDGNAVELKQVQEVPLAKYRRGERP